MPEIRIMIFSWKKNMSLNSIDKNWLEKDAKTNYFDTAVINEIFGANKKKLKFKWAVPNKVRNPTGYIFLRDSLEVISQVRYMPWLQPSDTCRFNLVLILLGTFLDSRYIYYVPYIKRFITYISLQVKFLSKIYLRNLIER